jgi:hypothetical protein
MRATSSSTCATVSLVRPDAKKAFGFGPLISGGATAMATINYKAEAELFPPRRRSFSRGPIGYERFNSAAEAIRFAMEELPPELLLGAYLEVEEDRFDGPAIRQLYESEAYPLVRKDNQES